MIKIKERSYLIKLLIFFAGFVIGWFFYLILFAIFVGGPNGEALPRNYTISACILSLVTMVVYMVFSEYNYLKRLQLTAKTLYSDISVYKARERNLLSKAEQIIIKFLEHESDIQKSVASLRSGNAIKSDSAQGSLSLKDLKMVMENYPVLKSDQHISTILNQLDESENTILNSKLRYNEYVTYYNSAIVSFPAVTLAGWWKLAPQQLYVDNDSDE